MELIVDRFKLTSDHTLGRLLEESFTRRRWFHCFTLEDVYRAVKVPGSTRIPAGRYEIKLRPEGGKYAKYLERFGEWQKPGMLHVRDVPGFEWILIHPGNSVKDTEGCLLVGDGYASPGVLEESRAAYERIYKLVSERLRSGEKVFITYEDNDRA